MKFIVGTVKWIMNPAKKYELAVMKLVGDLIQKEELGFSPQTVKVFHQKGYYSPIRENEIKFDVSLEVYRKNQENPFFVWVWECKNYSESNHVPVDDVEEFHSKLNQIGPDKTKGTIVTSSWFQKGAFNAAKSYGIGLVRYLPDIELTFVMEDDPQTEAERYLTDPDIRRSEIERSEFYGFTESEKFYLKTSDFLVEEFKSISESL